jgi:hypothetical protein
MEAYRGYQQHTVANLCRAAVAVGADRETQRQRDRERDRETERDRREREMQRDREKQLQRDKETDRDRERDTQRETQRERWRQREALEPLDSVAAGRPLWRSSSCPPGPWRQFATSS